MNVLTSIVYAISKIQQFKHQRRLEVVQNEITTHFMHSSISRSQPTTSSERSDDSKILPFNILKGRRRNAIGPVEDVEDPSSNQPGFQMGSCCFKSVTLNYLISIIFIVMYCVWMFGALNYVGIIHVIDIYKYVLTHANFGWKKELLRFLQHSRRNYQYCNYVHPWVPHPLVNHNGEWENANSHPKAMEWIQRFVSTGQYSSEAKASAKRTSGLNFVGKESTTFVYGWKIYQGQ